MVATFPNLLAAGVTSEGSFRPFELFAGEGPTPTDRGVVGSFNIAQFVPVARNEDGLIVAWSDVIGFASLAGTFSGVGTAADTITVNGVVFTLQTSLNTSHDVVIGGTAAITATNFAAKINAIPDEVNVRATRSGAVVTLIAMEPGVGGNSIAVSESGTGFSFAGAATALAGGSAETENKAIGISAQAAVAGDNIPFFIGGTFNWAAITWPTSIDTLPKAKRVFERSMVHMDKLLGSAERMTFA